MPNEVLIARVCHEANRALQIEQADPTIPVSEPWDSLDEETKRSAIDGVRGVLSGNDPAQSHDRWMDFKRREGWKYGPVKDQGKKTHPSMVPYPDLPSHHKIKDLLFFNIVQALSAEDYDPNRPPAPPTPVNPTDPERPGR